MNLQTHTDADILTTECLQCVLVAEEKLTWKEGGRCVCTVHCCNDDVLSCNLLQNDVCCVCTASYIHSSSYYSSVCLCVSLSVCLSVCVSLHTETVKLLIRI